MGCFNVYCGVSNITITHGTKCCVVPLKESKDYPIYVPVCPAIFGEYDDYGKLQNIIKDDNTELIERYYGCKIEDFCDFLTYYVIRGKGDTYYDSFLQEKFKYHHSEIETYKSMWIITELYDFLSPKSNTGDLPIIDTPSDFKYNPKDMYTIFGLPIKEYKNLFWYYTEKDKKTWNFNGTLQHEYVKKLNQFKDRFDDLDTINSRLKVANNTFMPHNDYLVGSQGGHHKLHQLLLKKILEVNKSLICKQYGYNTFEKYDNGY